MVSLRCKLLVAEEINKIGLMYLSIDLGMIELKQDITPEQRKMLQKELASSGLELMEDKNAILVEKIKNTIIGMVHYSDEYVKPRLSDLCKKR